MFRLVVRLLFLFYRWVLSPALHLLSGPGMGCRFNPSCSRYFEEAIQVWGVWKGTSLGVKRILRCNPAGSSGNDPVPQKIQKDLLNERLS